MDSTITLWEERTCFHFDGDILINGQSPTNLIINESREDELDSDHEEDGHASQTENISQPSESSLELKMRDMINLDTTGKDFVIVENIMEHEEQGNFLEEDPKICNENNTTYWTGGGGELLNEEGLPTLLVDKQLEDFPTRLDDKELDVGQTVPHLAVEIEPVQSNARMYLPLQKTLRNLRLLDMKLQYNNHHLALEHPSSECNNDSSSDESDSKFTEPTEKENKPQVEETEAERSYLIELLSQCHFRLEQMEELRHYSQKLAWSLWEAQETNEYLKEKLAELHRDNVQKEEEIFLLTEELIKSQRLCQKWERVAEMKAKATQPSNHVENQPKQQQFESVYTINDHLPNCQPTGQDTSKICVIL